MCGTFKATNERQRLWGLNGPAWPETGQAASQHRAPGEAWEQARHQHQTGHRMHRTGPGWPPPDTAAIAQKSHQPRIQQGPDKAGPGRHAKPDRNHPARLMQSLKTEYPTHPALRILPPGLQPQSAHCAPSPCLPQIRLRLPPSPLPPGRHPVRPTPASGRR